ncbi:hypothetical protein NDU88_003174 [Pleurodeles waltl]|uniref:Uncharacterized protein n=1 Tax=Pleurodeles waltl TaxID=8319 RepID=A0AAV7M822_PLEWA|nr:hypothetical protein NDU88_003174 [Pleurodeles waltl]
MLALGYTVTHPLHTMTHTDAIIMLFSPAGPLPKVTRQEGPDISTPPPEEAHSDDSSSVQLDPDDQPGPSWASGQSVPLTLAQATTELPHSGNTRTAPTQRAHTSVPRTRQSAVRPPLQGTQANPPPNNNRDLGAVVVGTRSRGRRPRNTGELGWLLCNRGRTGLGNPLSTRPSPPSCEHTTTPRRRWQQYWPSFRRPVHAEGTVFGLQGGTQNHQLRPEHHRRGAEGNT